MTIIPEQQTHENRDERWNMIGRLVETYGTEDDKNAWMLCRGDAAEWRIKSRGDISNIIKELKIKKRTKKEERIVFVVFSIVIIIGSYIAFKALGVL